MLRFESILCWMDSYFYFESNPKEITTHIAFKGSLQLSCLEKKEGVKIEPVTCKKYKK